MIFISQMYYQQIFQLGIVIKIVKSLILKDKELIVKFLYFQWYSMRFVIIRPRSYNKQHINIMHVSLLMSSAVKNNMIMVSAVKDIMPDASFDIQHSTVLYSLIHTAVTGASDVNSGKGFISDHIILSIEYNSGYDVNLSLNCLIFILELDTPLTQKKISKSAVQCKLSVKYSTVFVAYLPHLPPAFLSCLCSDFLETKLHFSPSFLTGITFSCDFGLLFWPTVFIF